MPTRRRAVQSMALGIGLGLSGCVGGNGNGNGNGGTETIQLEVGTPFGPEEVSTTNPVIYPWVDKVNEKLDDYQIEYSLHHSGSVGEGGELFNLAKEGALDFVMDNWSYYGGEYNLLGVMSIPGLFPREDDHLRASDLAIHELTTPGGEDFLYQEEFKPQGLRPIVGIAIRPGNLTTRETKVESLDDLEGLVCRSPGGITDHSVEALGMSPAQFTGAEQYSAFQQGSVDATQLYFPGVVQLSLHELCDYTISNIHFGGNAINWVMGENTFQNFPQPVQEAMTEAGDEIAEEYFDRIRSMEQEMIDGPHFTTEDPPGEDQVLLYDTPVIDEIRDNLASVEDTWIDQQEENGLPASETVDLYHTVHEKHLNE